MNIKRFITTSLIAMSVSVTPALAQPNHESHERLWSTLQLIGINTVLNHKHRCAGKDIDGSYNSRARVLVICQDGSYAGGPQSDWTENDYDTLRHEAHHVLQDCNNGELGDGLLGDLFEDADEWEQFVTNGLTTDQIKSIVKSYTESGAGPKVIAHELEAFSASNSVDASTIANKLVEFCSL